MQINPSEFKLLIVDDVQSNVLLLKALLGKEGYRIASAMNGQEALAMIEKENPDLILLDVMMPGMDGFETLEKIRLLGNVPVLMLTAKDDNASKVKGLQMGADDYLTKPFNLEEFNARVQSLIRRYLYLNDPEKRTVIEYKGLLINLSEKRVVVNGSEVALPNKEFELLVYCAQNPKKILSKKRIFEAVWKQEYMYDDNTIMATMSRLRKKIDGLSAPDEYIQTIKGMGYRFNAPSDSG